MKAFSALVLASAGCAMVSMALVRSRVMWLGLGFPLIAIGLWMSGWRMSPRAFFRWAAQFCSERDRDCEVIWSMMLDAPETFRERRASFPLGPVDTRPSGLDFSEGA